MPTKKSAVSAAGRGFSGNDELAVSSPDRIQAAQETQTNGVLEAEANAVLRAELDGEARGGKFGFLVETELRLLWVPYTAADSPVSALIACRRFGLLRAKLNRMSPQDAHYVEMTTLVPPIREN